MFGFRKCKDFRISGGGASAYPQFHEYKPMDYGQQEVSGNVDWNGNFLPHIPTILPNSLPPLPPALERLIEHAWQETSVSAEARSAGRSGVQAGSQRGTVSPTKFDVAYTKITQPATRNAKSFDVQAKHAPHLKTAFAQDWSCHNDIPRVMAYTFRGDRRYPDNVKLTGGFSPPISRTDDYYMKTVVYPQFCAYMKHNFSLDISEVQFRTIVGKSFGKDLQKQFLHYGVWRATIERESLHLGRMVAFEALKGFISTTKAVSVAKAYAGTDGGWVYVTFVDGGYHLPAKGASHWTSIFGEQEIAYPGAIPWAMVQGFRQVGANRKFVGNIFLRESFDTLEKEAALEVLKLLSGKLQN